MEELTAWMKQMKLVVLDQASTLSLVNISIFALLFTYSIYEQVWLRYFKFLIEPNEISPSTSRACCYANTAECLSCGAGMSIDEYCRIYPSTIGCEGL